MPATPTPLPLPTDLFAQPDALLRTVLDISLTAVQLLRPVYGPDGVTITDFVLDYLNPAGQRLSGLPERPDGSARAWFPHLEEAGIFAYYRRVFESGTAESYAVSYQADGLDNYCRLRAQRCGEVLVISISTDSAGEPRPAVEEALRQSQAREQAARAEAEAQRQRLHETLQLLPAPVATYRGPDHVFEVVNPAYQRLFPTRTFLGRPLRQVFPEADEQGVLALFDRVYQTGEPVYGQEQELWIDFDGTGRREQIFANFTVQALRNAQGQIDGVLDFSYDVTEQVLARQRVQELNDELATTNEELYAANEEYLGSNTELLRTQQLLQALNHDLEARVAERTQEAQAARAAAERERERLEHLFMQAPAPIVILGGPEFVLELVNPAYQQLFPNRELLGKPLLTALPELAGSEIPAILARVQATGETYVAQEMSLQLARHAGGPLEETYWTFSYQARRNAAGAVDGALNFAYEVTEQVRARRRAEESEQYFRLMADNVPAMLWVTDASGSCTYLNQQWYAFTGQTEAEALGLGWTAAVHPDDTEAAGAGFADASARHVPFHLLYRLRRHDGAYRWAIDSGLPRFSAAGAFEGIVGTVIDVHEQKLGEQALRRLTKKLRQARDEAQTLNVELQGSNEQLLRTNADLDNFIYTASHDLKAPITNIEGLLLALQTELPAECQPDDVPYILTLMLGSVERFKTTIAHLSEVTKLQKEHDQPAAEVSVAAVVEDVRLDLAPALAAAGTQLVVDMAECPTISFALKNLRSIVYNLLSNAIKYRHPERAPEVRISCRPDGPFQVLEVQDNGLGLNQAQQAQLFIMFRRLHSHVEGTGIGLYMVKKIIDNAGGRIEVQSAPGVGSTFRVYFPVNGG